MRSVITPQTGFARNRSDAEYPFLWDALLASWCPSLNPGGGVTLWDWSPYQRHATLTNMTPASDWVTVAGRGGLDFDGTDDYTTASLPNVGNLDGSFTVSCWVRTRSNSAGVAYMSSTNGSASWFRLGHNSLGKVTLGFVNSGTNFSGNTSISNNVWFHCAAVRNTYTDTISIYYNGKLDATPANDTTGSPTSYGNFFLGAQTTGSQRFNGILDDARVYRRALSAAEIELLARWPAIAYLPRIRRRWFIPESTEVAGDGDATGGLGTITLSGPAGSATGGAAAAGSLGTITVSALAGTATGGAAASGGLGTIALSGPAGTAFSGVVATGGLGTITLSGPAGSATGTAVASGSLGTITLVALAGSATGGAAASGGLGTITLSGPTGTAEGTSGTGDAVATGGLGTIYVFAPTFSLDGTVSVDSSQLNSATISLSQLNSVTLTSAQRDTVTVSLS